MSVSSRGCGSTRTSSRQRLNAVLDSADGRPRKDARCPSSPRCSKTKRRAGPGCRCPIGMAMNDAFSRSRLERRSGIIPGCRRRLYAGCLCAIPRGCAIRKHFCALISMRHQSRFLDDSSIVGPSKRHSRRAARISASRRNGNGPISPSRGRRRRCSGCFRSLPFGRPIPKSPAAFAQDRPRGITNANLPSATPWPPFEGSSGARRIYQCPGTTRMAWKFQPPSGKDSQKRSATRHKIRKVEVRRCYRHGLWQPSPHGEQQLEGERSTAAFILAFQFAGTI